MATSPVELMILNTSTLGNVLIALEEDMSEEGVQTKQDFGLNFMFAAGVVFNTVPAIICCSRT